MEKIYLKEKKKGVKNNKPLKCNQFVKITSRVYLYFYAM